MNSRTEFDSEFCHVRYLEDDKIVLLSWEKFARLEDYREPTRFALNLLRRYPGSNFVIDAGHGFEDDPADVEWGFSKLLPNMAKTGCKYIGFIMERAAEIKEEMDMWTREFGKYFAVVKAESYDQAVRKMRERVLVNVRYTVKPGKRDEFLKQVCAQGIIRASREEPGNCQYEYDTPVDSETDLFLMELWVSEEAQAAHGKTEHYQRLQALKKEYVSSVSIEKYHIVAESREKAPYETGIVNHGLAR